MFGFPLMTFKYQSRRQIDVPMRITNPLEFLDLSNIILPRERNPEKAIYLNFLKLGDGGVLLKPDGTR
jgi:hypothetical protein